MAKKLAKAKKLTAKRKLFLDAIRLLEKYFDDDGHVAGDMDELCCDVELLRDRSAKIKSLDSFCWICASAFWWLSCPKELRGDIDNCHETCRGGEAFQAAMLAGWSIGFDDGRSDMASERAQDRTT